MKAKMVSTWDQIVPWSTTCFFLWIFLTHPRLSSGHYGHGLTTVWCDAEPNDRYVNYKPSCGYYEGEVVWMHSVIASLGYFDTSMIYTKEGCLVDEGLQYGDNSLDCDNRATAGEDYGPIVVAYEGGDSSSSLGFLKFFPIETVDDCDAESDEVFSVYTRPEPYPPFGETSRPDDGAEVVIKDNDDNFYFEFDHYDVVERIGTPVTFTFKVKRRGVLQRKTIEYSTTEITANEDDFAPKNKANIKFAEDSKSDTGTIEILPDSETERPEVFMIELFFPVDADSTVCTGKIVHPGKAYVTIHDPKTTLFSIEQSEYSVTEPGSGDVKTFTFNIKRKGNLQGHSNIEYSIHDVSTTPSHDYDLPQSQSVSFESGSSNAVVALTVRSDASIEYAEIFEVSLHVSGDADLVTNPAKATVIIQDYSTTRSCVEFDSPNIFVRESDGSVDLTLRRTGNVEEAVYVDLKTTDIDARAQQDYSSLSNFPVHFGAQQTTATVTLSILDDQRKEDTESFKVFLQKSPRSLDNVDICSHKTEVSIKDDDHHFYLEGTLYKVNEGETFEINILRSGYLKKESTVRVAVIPDTATSGDYTVVGGDTTITFDVNQEFHPLVITANDDTEPENREEFTVQLLSDTDADEIGVPYQAKIEITSDDLLCDPDCVNGECVDVNTCVCQTGFTGPLCETSLCALPCINGECIDINTCDCFSGYSGPQCDIDIEVVPGGITIVESPPGTPAEFTDDLNNSTSTAYKELEAEVIGELTEIFSTIPGFMAVKVLGFSEGSIIVNYEVEFDSGTVASPSEVSQMLEDGIDNAGILGDSNLKVDPSTITVGTSEEPEESSGSEQLISIILGGASVIFFLLAFLFFISLWIRTRRSKTPIQEQPTLQQDLSAQPLPMQQFDILPYDGDALHPFGGISGQGDLPMIF